MASPEAEEAARILSKRCDQMLRYGGIMGQRK